MSFPLARSSFILFLAEIPQGLGLVIKIEAFGYEDEDDCEDEIFLQFFRVSSKTTPPGKLYCTFFHQKS